MKIALYPAKPSTPARTTKPGLRSHLKPTLNEKKRACAAHAIVEVQRVQARLRKEIKEAKSPYKEKMEKLFSSGNLREARIGIKKII